jgi:hypothetical protein
MSLTIRRTIAVFLALLAVLAAIVWTLVAASWLENIAQHFSRPVPLSQADAPRFDSHDRSAHLYYEILVGALILAVGVIASLLVLVPRLKFLHRAGIYIGFLLIVLPATWFNFNLGDTVLAPSFQFFLNFICIFLSATVALSLTNFPTETIDVTVLKVMAATLLWFACLTPALFNLIWFLNWSHLLSLQQTSNITWRDLTGVAAVASAIIAGLNYRREMRKTTRVDRGGVRNQ